jgi:hypothetical protein
MMWIDGVTRKAWYLSYKVVVRSWKASGVDGGGLQTLDRLGSAAMFSEVIFTKACFMAIKCLGKPGLKGPNRDVGGHHTVLRADSTSGSPGMGTLFVLKLSHHGFGAHDGFPSPCPSVFASHHY